MNTISLSALMEQAAPPIPPEGSVSHLDVTPSGPPVDLALHNIDDQSLVALIRSNGQINKTKSSMVIQKAWYQVAAQYNVQHKLNIVADLTPLKLRLSTRWHNIR